MDNDQLLWQNQSAEPLRMTPDELRKRMEQLDRRTRTRNRGAYQACGFLVIAFLWSLTVFPNDLQRIGAVLTIAGVGVLFYQIRANKLATRKAAESGSTASLAFHRGELARQRDFHRGKLFWSRFLALMPGPLLGLFGFYQAYPHLAKILVVEGITFILVFIATIPVNRRLARKYQRQLDELDRMQKEQS